MNSVEKTIKILNCLSDAQGSLGVTEISSKLSIPKSTTHRLLSILLRYSIVSKDKETSKYMLGIQLLKYSNSFYNSFDLQRNSKQILKQACNKTGLTTFLSIWQGGMGVCIDSVSTSQNSNSHQLFVELGKIMPFHCAASAKILLANQSPEEIFRVVNQDVLRKYTPKTIVDPKKMIEHLIEIKSNGFAICDEELEEGIRAVSAPIKNINGKVVASITITGLVSRISMNNINKFIEIVVSSAKEISSIVGYGV
jgi:IclR family transcriptional regulator, KDG regulon repressor